MIQGMFDSGSLPVLERLAEFTQARHRVLADNVANLSTPYYKPRDLDPRAFQAQLGEAIDRRRQTAARSAGALDAASLESGADTLEGDGNTGVLFHDQNNRDLERIMQHMAENTLAHRTAVELMRNQFEHMRTAIRERV